MRSASAINICSNNRSIYDDEDYEIQLKNITINNKHRSSVTELNNRKLDSNLLFQTDMNSYDNINRENNNELLLDDYNIINQQQLSSSNLEFLSDNNNNNNNNNSNSNNNSYSS